MLAAASHSGRGATLPADEPERYWCIARTGMWLACANRVMYETTVSDCTGQTVRGRGLLGPVGKARTGAMSAGGAGGGGVGGVVDENSVHEFSGDFFAAVEHGLDRGRPDEVCQAADHAAGA